MDSTRAISSTRTMQPVRQTATRDLVLTQSVLGACAHLFFVMPYARRVSGLDKLALDKKYLFEWPIMSACYDTILLGGLFWRRGCYRFSFLVTRACGRASALHRALSSRIGFLLERGKLNLDRIHKMETFGRSIEDFRPGCLSPKARAAAASEMSPAAARHLVRRQGPMRARPCADFHGQHAAGLQQNRPVSSVQRVAPDQCFFWRTNTTVGVSEVGGDNSRSL